MSQGFSHIVTLSCMHRYYSNSLFSSVNVTYSERTIKLFRDLGIVLKTTENGFLLLAEDIQLLKDYRTDNPIQVYISVTDPNYINFTDLEDFDPRDMVCYFNNNAVTWKDEDQSFQLHSLDFVSSETYVKVIHGSFQISDFQEGENYLFRDAAGDEISEIDIIRIQNSEGKFQIKNLNEGLIQVFAGSTLIDQFYYNPSAVWTKPFAIIELFPHQIFNHYNEKHFASYTLHYNNRHTIWKYYFKGDVYQNFDDLSIINKRKEREFHGPERLEILDNTTYLVFESNNYLPLTEHSVDSFQLIDSYDETRRSGKVVIKNLPHPSPQQLHRDDSVDTKTMYSQIFII